MVTCLGTELWDQFPILVMGPYWLESEQVLATTVSVKSYVYQLCYICKKLFWKLSTMSISYSHSSASIRKP